MTLARESALRGKDLAAMEGLEPAIRVPEDNPT